MTIHVSVSGKGKPLVLLHGWGFDSQIWQPVLQDLERDFRLYRIDLPGFGKSALMDWTDFKKQILATLPEHFALAGWSLGGLFAMRLASEAPERVSHLMGIATSPCFVEEETWAGIKMSVLEGFHASLARDPEETLLHFQRLQKYTPFYIPENKASREALAQGLSMLQDWDLRLPLDHFKNPAAFIFGRLDAITPFAVLEAMLKRYPHFQYALFRKSAHMPFLSETPLFLQTLRTWLL